MSKGVQISFSAWKSYQASPLEVFWGISFQGLLFAIKKEKVLGVSGVFNRDKEQKRNNIKIV